MSETRPASKQKIAILGIGSAFAVGAAYWSISSALAPPPVAHTLPPAPTTTGTSAAPAGGAGASGASNTAAAIPGALPGSAADIAARSSSNAPARAEQEPGARQNAVSEATLAPEADPFAPLQGHLMPPPLIIPEAAHVAGRPSVVTKINPFAFPNLNGVLGQTSVTPKRAPVTPVADAPPPELVGTLLGDEPSAVFRGQSQLVAVPVGGSFGAWKVVNVSHGGVVVKGMGRTLHLGLASTFPAPSSEASDNGDVSTPARTPRPVPVTPVPSSPPAYTVAGSSASSVAGETGSGSPTGTETGNSGVTAGDTTIPVQQDNTIPSLRDSAITPEGGASATPTDAPVPTDAAASPTRIEPARTVVDGTYAPFRGLAATDVNGGKDAPAGSIPPSSAAARAISQGLRQFRVSHHVYRSAAYQAH